MGSIWLDGRAAAWPSIVDVLRAGGVAVAEYPGWQTRSRGSGGFEALLGTVHHHTASSTTPDRDLHYMVEGCPDAPVSNGLLDRTGLFTVIAAGASNHAGAGGPRGGIPRDGANARAFGIEAANSGLGETWPNAQLDAYLMMTRALHDGYGLPIVPTVMFSHHEWTLTDPNNPRGTARKIDPAGGQTRWPTWNSSQTWNFDAYRASALFDDIPDEGDDEMGYLYSDPRWVNVWAVPPGTNVDGAGAGALQQKGWPSASSQNDHAVAACCFNSWGITGESPGAVIAEAVRLGFLVT